MLPPARQNSLTMRQQERRREKLPSPAPGSPPGSPTALPTVAEEVAEDLLPQARTAKAALLQMNGALHQAWTPRG